MRRAAGKFRNMIQSSIIPRSTSRHQETGFGLSSGSGAGPGEQHPRSRRVELSSELYEDEDPAMFSTTLSSSLGLSLPNPAPTVDLDTSDDGRVVTVFHLDFSNFVLTKKARLFEY